MPLESIEKGEQDVSDQPLKAVATNRSTIIFITLLSTISAVILSLLASLLAQQKATAKELDRSIQMMIAAKLLDHNGYFLMENEHGESIPAKYENGTFVPGSPQDTATKAEILSVYNERLQPLLVDPEGGITTFEKANIPESEYLVAHRKTGYYKEPYKLIYKIAPRDARQSSPKEEAAALSTPDMQAQGWVVPVNGFGLWDAIYGYLAIAPDGVTVIGATWYDQKETPGLGANIADPPWQNLFPGKKIFQADASGQIDFKRAPLGLTVVRGKVSEVYGDSPKGKSAIDGMAGATLTGNGVTDAYSAVLEAYRSFLMRVSAVHQGSN